MSLDQLRTVLCHHMGRHLSASELQRVAQLLDSRRGERTLHLTQLVAVVKHFQATEQQARATSPSSSSSASASASVAEEGEGAIVRSFEHVLNSGAGELERELQRAKQEIHALCLQNQELIAAKSKAVQRYEEMRSRVGQLEEQQADLATVLAASVRQKQAASEKMEEAKRELSSAEALSAALRSELLLSQQGMEAARGEGTRLADLQRRAEARAAQLSEELTSARGALAAMQREQSDERRLTRAAATQQSKAIVASQKDKFVLEQQKRRIVELEAETRRLLEREAEQSRLVADLQESAEDAEDASVRWARREALAGEAVGRRRGAAGRAVSASGREAAP